MDPVVVAVAFGAIFVVELPDKTFVASLLLATRYRGLYVWVGVASAFAVQTLVAVSAGGLVALLPRVVTHLVAATVFLLGAVLLLRSAPSSGAGDEEGAGILARRVGRSGWSVIGASFLVIFAAEWGDLSQLLTASLTAHYRDPVSVFVGAWAALAVVSGLAVVGGRLVQQHLPLAVLHYVGAGVCAVLAVLTLVQLVG